MSVSSNRDPAERLSASAKPVRHHSGREIAFAFFATPLMAIAAGTVLFWNKAELDTVSNDLGFLAFWIVIGSFFAAPTTLIGLPVIGVYIPRSSARPVALAFAGFVLGWLTMMFWAFVFFGMRYYSQLQNGYLDHQFISFCMVGAVCGAVTGLAMGLITLLGWKADA